MVAANSLSSARLVFDVPSLMEALGVSRGVAYGLMRRHGIRLGPKRLVMTREQLDELLQHGERRPLRGRVAR